MGGRAASGGVTVEKFIGDGVMAVFGLPRAHGGDAEQAVAATFELRDPGDAHLEGACPSGGECYG